jgi:hypothetical protein
LIKYSQRLEDFFRINIQTIQTNEYLVVSIDDEYEQWLAEQLYIPLNHSTADHDEYCESSIEKILSITNTWSTSFFIRIYFSSVCRGFRFIRSMSIDDHNRTFHSYIVQHIDEQSSFSNVIQIRRNESYWSMQLFHECFVNRWVRFQYDLRHEFDL